jgi:hypothetical protein
MNITYPKLGRALRAAAAKVWYDGAFSLYHGFYHLHQALPCALQAAVAQVHEQYSNPRFVDGVFHSRCAIAIHDVV